MKKIETAILASLFLLAGCKKEKEVTSSITGSNYQIKEYYPTNDVNIKDMVESFIEYSENYNPASGNRNLFPDMEVNQAAWLLEASQNYLENENMDELGEGSTISFNLSAPVFDNGGELMISGEQMTNIFNEALLEIANEEQMAVEDTKFIDYQISSVNSTTVSFQVVVVMGPPTPLGGIGAWPAGNTDLVTASQVLEDSINKYLIKYNQSTYGVSFLSNVNAVVNGGQRAKSSTIFGNIYATSPLSYNCSDCLFYSNHPFSTGTGSDLPNVHFDYFFNNGLTLINNMRNSLRPYASNSLTVSCDVSVDFLGSTATHTITKVYIGTANVI